MIMCNRRVGSPGPAWPLTNCLFLVFVFLCVCVHSCMHINMCVGVCVHACARICMCACVHARMLTHTEGDVKIEIKCFPLFFLRSIGPLTKPGVYDLARLAVKLAQ